MSRVEVKGKERKEKTQKRAEEEEGQLKRKKVIEVRVQNKVE